MSGLFAWIRDNKRLPTSEDFMSNPDLIAGAASAIRRDAYEQDARGRTFMLAVADWLEVTHRDVGTSSLAYHAAADVARHYLEISGREPTP